MGNDEAQAYLEIQGQSDRRNVEDVQSLAHALRNDAVSNHETVVRTAMRRASTRLPSLPLCVGAPFPPPSSLPHLPTPDRCAAWRFPATRLRCTGRGTSAACSRTTS